MTACCAALLSCVGLATASPVEYGRAVLAGAKLTTEEAEALDERLANDARDSEARSRLIAYHFSNAFRDPDSRAAHSGHVLWLIRHAPLAYMLGTRHGQIHPGLDSDGYRGGKEAWARHLSDEPTNAAFLGHAANFLSESLLDGLSTAALLAERYDVARSYARALLEGTPRYSLGHGHVHKGNVILGRVALAEDDVELAKYHLLETGKLREPSGLGASGPNMKLAADLLERGEREVVLEYFEFCATFWPSDKLKDWTALVESGRTPDLGANLVY